MLKIVNHLGEIFNEPTGGESATEEKGLKIWTPNQKLSRFPISLVQLKAGNNSAKNLKTKLGNYYISLCRSKKLTKNVYNNLISAI